MAGGVLFGPLSWNSGTLAPPATRMAVGGADPARRPALVVAGPEESPLAAWARRLEPDLAEHLGQAPALRFAGGVDGVTGANQFDARAVPDGGQALLFPGKVTLAWLAGDARVRLNPSDLLPLLSVSGPGILMTRVKLPQAGGAAKPLRVALSGPADPAISALLALDLLGIPAMPARAPADAWQAAGSGLADAVFVQGFETPSLMPRLRAAGFTPAIALGRVGGLPSASDLLACSRGADPLAAAWRACAQAATLCAVLALPRLSPGAAIRRWRDAARAAASDTAMSGEAARDRLSVMPGETQASPVLDPAAQLAFHRWVASRLGATGL